MSKGVIQALPAEPLDAYFKVQRIAYIPFGFFYLFECNNNYIYTHTHTFPAETYTFFFILRNKQSTLGINYFPTN